MIDPIWSHAALTHRATRKLLSPQTNRAAPYGQVVPRAIFVVLTTPSITLGVP